MKRFITISLLSMAVLPILACAWIDTHNYSLFCVRPGVDFPERVNTICENNWKEYLGTTEERWRYYDADDIIAAAQKKDRVRTRREHCRVQPHQHAAAGETQREGGKDHA